jgi:hypothetical protein
LEGFLVVSETGGQVTVGGREALSWWQWAWRLLRVAVMLILAFWLSRSGDAFIYQGF